MAIEARSIRAATRVHARNGFFSRPAAIGVVPAMFVAACFLAPLQFRPTPTSFTLFDALVIGLAFCMVVTQERTRLLPTWLFVSAYVFLLFGMLSTFRATAPFDSVTQLLQFVFVFLLLLPVVLTLVRSSHVSRLSMLLFTAGAVVAVAMTMLWGGDIGMKRARVFYGDNPNSLGYPSAYVLPFVLHLASDRWRRTRSVISLGLALVAGYLLLWAVAASGSRSSAVGLLVGFMVFLGMGFRATRWSRIRRIGLAIAVTALVYWLYQSGHLPAMLTRRLEQTVMMQEDATRNRMDLAIAAWLGFLDSPLLGVGFENFRHVAGRYVPGAQHDPHNLWLHLLVHVGLVGTAAFAVLIGGWFLVLLRVRHTTADPSERQLIAAFIASMSAILTIHMFVPLILQRPYWLVYGLGLATALALDEGRRQAPVSGWNASSGETPLKSGTSWERTG